MPSRPSSDAREGLSGIAATLTVLATGLGYAITIADPTILCANISAVGNGLGMTTSMASFTASLATLTMAAAVLGAGTLGDLYGMRRMFAVGACGTIACGLLAAAAPTTAVLIVARAGMGVALAFLIGLSLSIVNAAFAPGRRAAAIALYFGVGYAIATPLPALGSVLAAHFGWRACFLASPLLAALTLAITLRFVPEMPRAARSLDVPGLVLIAVALLGMIYGISQLQPRITGGGIAAILVGLVAGAGFVAREVRTPEPALDLRVFRSGRFNAAVTAGMAFNFLIGGTMVLLAFYLVTVRRESAEVLSLLLIPATALAALAATGAGPAAIRFGNRSVLVAGLVVMLSSLLLLRLLGEHTSMVVVFAVVALNSIGGALVGTPQATIMMASAPAQLGGAISGVKCAVNAAGYSLGPTVFALVGINLFLSDSLPKLAGFGITRDKAIDALEVRHGGVVSGAHVVDPDKARAVVAEATEGMLNAIHSLGLIMAAVPIAAILLAVVLIKPTVPHRSPISR